MQEHGHSTISSRQCLTDLERNILMHAWKNANLPPRVKTFAWRLIRRALASGSRASRLSSHIKKECSQCGLPETDVHLFFHCQFARAVWFAAPLGFRTDNFDHAVYPSNIIQSLLASAHSEVSVHSVFAILCMLWKARNDLLFNRKSWSVLQVHCAARTLLSAGKKEQQIQVDSSP